MEISIKWIVCRLCLREETPNSEGTDSPVNQMKNIYNEGDLVQQIYEFAGILVENNDNLPQKICRKCLMLIKHYTNFRNICKSSDLYLQSVLQKTKSTTSSFKFERSPENLVLDDIFERCEFIEKESDLITLQENNSISIERKRKLKTPVEVGTNRSQQDMHNSLKIKKIDFPTSSNKFEPYNVSNILYQEEINEYNTQCSDENDCDKDLSKIDETYSSNINYIETVEDDVQIPLKISMAMQNAEDVTDEINDHIEIDEDDCERETFFYILNSERDDTEDKDRDATADEKDPEISTTTEFIEIKKENSQANSPRSDTSESSVSSFSAFTIDVPITKIEHNSFQATSISEENTIRKINKAAKRFVCEICGNHFTSNSLMKYHMRIHQTEKRYECELCFKRFNAAYNLSAHMRVHTGEKRYKCQYCDRRFADRSTHIKHERVHTNEKPFTCTVCNKSFSLSTSLKAHEKIHTGEKPFKCHLCDKSFKLPHQLKAHQNTIIHKHQ